MRVVDPSVAVGLNRGGGSGGFLTGGQGLGVGLVEHGLDDLLLFRVQNLGQFLVELRLFLLEVCTKH